MAFTVEDFEDLYRLLSEHPDWRARLRPLILGDEFIQVPERLNRIDERLDRISETLVEFDERMNRIATLLEVLTGRMGRVETRLGAVDGRLLELKYGDNLGNWFPGHVLHPERLFVDDLERLLEAEERGIVSEEELDSIAAVDLIVRGVQRRDSGAELVLLAEVSTTINRDDVERAGAAAEILRRAGYNALGFVGGYRASADARRLASELQIVVDLQRQAG